MRTLGASRTPDRNFIDPPHLFPPHNAAYLSGYTSEKVSENVTAEIMGVVSEEALESYRREIVHEVSSNTIDDLESNADRVVTWLEQWRKDRGAVASETG